MSDMKNDEKLRVLQERLAQIKQKQDTPQSHIKKMEDVIEIPTPKNETPKKERKPINLSWIKRGLIISSVAYGIFYGYTNINFNSLAPKFLDKENIKELSPTQIVYNFNLEGNNIAIVSTPTSISDEGSARAIVNDLKIKGFKCDYIYLPNHSNQKNEVFKVFIGPYENKEETKQWAKNLQSEFNIITL
tara:strand:- start:325 stop:891 length:567 start_codon:yes stop_codon:yes gene_type:complete